MLVQNPYRFTDSGTLQMKVISQRREQVRWHYNDAVVAVKTEILANYIATECMRCESTPKFSL